MVVLSLHVLHVLHVLRFARFARFAHFARFQSCTFRIPVCIPAYLPIAHARYNRSDAWLHDAGKSRGLPDAYSIEFYGKLTAEVAELPLAA